MNAMMRPMMMPGSHTMMQGFPGAAGLGFPMGAMPMAPQGHPLPGMQGKGGMPNVPPMAPPMAMASAVEKSSEKAEKDDASSAPDAGAEKRDASSSSSSSSSSSTSSSSSVGFKAAEENEAAVLAGVATPPEPIEEASPPEPAGVATPPELKSDSGEDDEEEAAGGNAGVMPSGLLGQAVPISMAPAFYYHRPPPGMESPVEVARALYPSAAWEEVGEGRSMEELQKELEINRRQGVSVETQTEGPTDKIPEDCIERWFIGSSFSGPAEPAVYPEAAAPTSVATAQQAVDVHEGATKPERRIRKTSTEDAEGTTLSKAASSASSSSSSSSSSSGSHRQREASSEEEPVDTAADAALAASLQGLAVPSAMLLVLRALPLHRRRHQCLWRQLRALLPQPVQMCQRSPRIHAWL